MSDMPYVAPPDGGLRQAMVDARERRFKSAGISTTSLAAAVILATALAGVQGQQSLIQQPTPERPAVTELVPMPHDTGPAPKRNQARTVLTFSNGNASSSARGAAVVPGPAVPDQGSPTTTTSRAPYKAGRITRNEGVLSVPNPQCTFGGDEATALCPYASTTDTGDVTELYADVCSTRTTAATLTYPGRNEVDFVVYRGTTPLWRWSSWHPDGGDGHALSVATGTCTQWTFAWSEVDASGDALPKGDYRLEATFLAEELTRKRVVTSSFTLR